MSRLLAVVVVLGLAGCADDGGQNSGVNGPTGRASDAGKIKTVTVRATWEQLLRPQSRDVVLHKIDLPKTAVFEGPTHFDGYYDSEQDLTYVAAYGNVRTSTDYGKVIKNGYYVIWQQPGHLKVNFPQTAWQLVDVEITDQQY